MATILPFPTTALRAQVRRLAVSNQRVPVGIRFRTHENPDDLEENRWNIQGNIQRRAGRSRAKGFTKKLAQSGEWFDFDIGAQRLRRFVREILPYVENGFVTVTIDGRRLSRDGLRVRA